MRTMTNCTPIIKTPIAILSRSPIVLSMLRTPRIRKVEELQNPTARRIVCRITESKKHRAVMGRKIVRLYP
jgi:hypothetical protein